MKKLLLAAALVCAVSVLPEARADQYPSKPIKLLLPFSAGGGGDALGRILANRFTEKLGQPVIVENRPGAGGTIGTRMAATSPADGYTITIGGMTTHILSPIVYKNLPYDSVKDFSSLGAIGTSAILVVVGNDVPVSNLAELKAYADAQNAPLQYASWGLGSTGHFCGEVLAQMGDFKLQHIPYKGTTQVVTDVMGGHIPVGFVDMPTGSPLVKDGKLKGIASCTRRSPSLPDVLSYKEQGIDFDRELNWAMYVPSGTPAPIVKKLSSVLQETLAEQAVIDSLLKLGITTNYIPGDAHEQANIADIAAWKGIADAAGLQAQ